MRSRMLVDCRVGWGSGIGRYIENVVPRVAQLLPRTAIDVLVNDADVDRAQASFADARNLRIRPVGIKPFSAGEQFGLSRYALDCDLTWFTNYWVPLAWRGRFATTVHDMIHLHPDLFPASGMKRQLSHATFSKVSRQASAVFFDSRFTRDEFVRLMGVPAAGIVTQLGGDHLEPAAAPPPAARDKRLLVVAAFKKHKNFETIVAAWRKVRVADDWLLTIIAPDEALRTSVDVGVMVDGLRGVEIRRGVSDAELRALYARSAMLLAPSLYEGFGLPLLEAFSAGAFAISSTAGSLVEIAEGADTALVNGRDVDGWVAAIERACARFDDEAFDVRAMSRRNMAHAASFRWDRTARTTADALSTLLGAA